MNKAEGPQELTRVVMKKWLGKISSFDLNLEGITAILEAVAVHVPSPAQAQSCRAESLFKANADRAIVNSIQLCDPKVVFKLSFLTGFG